MVEHVVASLDGLERVVERLRVLLPAHAIVFLRGDLAAGKTTLTKAVAKAKGIEGEVTSPTFSLQHCYGEGLYHYDLYRLDDEEFMQMGLFEEFDKIGWHFVEWGSDALKAFLEGAGYTVAMVNIVPQGTQREYRIEI